jgi:hypothetical protein
LTTTHTMDSGRDGTRLQLAADVIRFTGELRLRALGSSMLPSILPGDILTIRQADVSEMGFGEIVLCVRGNQFVIHRLLGRAAAASSGPRWITRGDALMQNDPPVDEGQVLGRVTRIERNGRSWSPAKPTSFARVVRWLVRHSRAAVKVVLWWHAFRSRVGAKPYSAARLSARECS